MTTSVSVSKSLDDVLSSNSGRISNLSLTKDELVILISEAMKDKSICRRLDIVGSNNLTVILPNSIKKLLPLLPYLKFKYNNTPIMVT